MRKWREIHSQDFLIICLFPPSLSISYIKNCHILSQNVKYGTFVANVTKKLNICAMGKNSGSNSLRGSSASLQARNKRWHCHSFTDWVHFWFQQLQSTAELSEKTRVLSENLLEGWRDEDKDKDIENDLVIKWLSETVDYSWLNEKLKLWH